MVEKKNSTLFHHATILWLGFQSHYLQPPSLRPVPSVIPLCSQEDKNTQEQRPLQASVSYEWDYYLVSFFIVVSEERIKGAKLSPSKAHLRCRMIKETANICSNLEKNEYWVRHGLIGSTAKQRDLENTTRYFWKNCSEDQETWARKIER